MVAEKSNEATRRARNECCGGSLHAKCSLLLRRRTPPFTFPTTSVLSMGCAGSKNLPSDPATDDQPEKPQPQPDEPVGCKDVVLDTQPAPILPPAPPTPCETYRDDTNATPCLDCPLGWLTRTATEGEKTGCTYYFCSELCVSQWDAPSGAAKPSAELTCTCGCLKSAHKVCAEWNPRPDTKPLTCNCGFLKEDHRPCHTYRVNMSAANFGECKCGFAKDVHDADAFASGGKAKRQDRTSKELRDGFAHKEYADCPNYTVNLQSANFGECKCGRPKGEHSPEALAKNAEAGQMSGTTRRDSSEVRSHFVHKEKVDCKKYEPDLTGGEMGVCKCGAKRGDHSDFALSADTGRHTAKQGALHVVAQKEYADCPHFELNMDPAAPFGTCRCGRSRVDHSEAALAADSTPHHAIRKNSCEVRREMEAKQEQIGTTVETHGAKVGVAYGLANHVHTAAEEEAAIQAGINARAGGAHKAAALHEFNNMIKASAPASAPA